MEYMFSKCSKLKEIKGKDNFNKNQCFQEQKELNIKSYQYLKNKINYSF